VPAWWRPPSGARTPAGTRRWRRPTCRPPAASRPGWPRRSPGTRSSSPRPRSRSRRSFGRRPSPAKGCGRRPRSSSRPPS
jgi:hypothetical protein